MSESYKQCRLHSLHVGTNWYFQAIYFYNLQCILVVDTFCSVLHNKKQLFATVVCGVMPLIETFIDISRNLDARYHDTDKKYGFVCNLLEREIKVHLTNIIYLD